MREELPLKNSLFPFPLLSRLRQGCGFPRFLPPGRVIEAVHRLPIRPRDEVSVDIDRDLDGMVSHLLLDVGEALPVGDQERGVRVPQGMNWPGGLLPAETFLPGRPGWMR